MIKEIVLKDFFSFRNETHIKLKKGANILLGINGSGKTTFLNSLSLLHYGLSGRFEELFQKRWGGYQNVVNYGEDSLPQSIELTYVFDNEALAPFYQMRNYSDDVYYKIIITPVGDQSYSIEETVFVYRGDTDMTNVFAHVKNGIGEFGVEQEDGNIHMERYSLRLSDMELSLSQVKDPGKYFLLNAIQGAVSTISLYDTFDTSAGSEIRKPAPYSKLERISPSGDNLVQWLSNAKNNDLSLYKRVLEYLNKVNPHFEEFNFKELGELTYLYLQESGLNRAVGMKHLSEGTLRFLLLTAILLNKKRGSIVGIDEPEGGLHPDMLFSISELIHHAAETSQLMIATHSPLLLNAFDLDDIIVFEKDATNSSIVKYYDEDDFPEMEGALPGQLWINGLIGGKRW